MPLIIDNTVPSPFLCNPFASGADIVVHSATKYLGGHGTTLAGVMVESGKFDWGNGKFPDMIEPSKGYHGVKFCETFGDFGYTMKARMEVLRVHGAALAPLSAWLMLQGIETLHAAHGAHCANALRGRGVPARRIRACAGSTIPACRSSPHHALARKYLRAVDGEPGASGMLTFGIKGGAAAGEKFIDALQFLSHLANIGDAKSLVIHPASTTHRQLDEEEQLTAGVPPDMVRLSVGLERSTTSSGTWTRRSSAAPEAPSRQQHCAMDERAARDVTLVRAIETADPDGTLLSGDERRHASRAATELAHWQAAQQRAVATADLFLARRAALLLDAAGPRSKTVRALRSVRWRPWIGRGLPVIALLLGLLVEQVADRQHLNLLAFPLFGIIAWNLVVYVLLCCGP